MNKQRVQFFDLISGLFMVRTVWLHIAQLSGLYPNETLDLLMRLTFFAMPWFYFRSGYFFKNQGRSSFDYIKKLARKLLIPFLLFAIIGFAFYLPFELITDERPLYRIMLSLPYSILRFGSGGMGNLPIWFLLSLFSTLVVFEFINKWNFNKVIWLFPIVGWILNLYNVTLPFGYSNIFIGVFFIYVGNLYKTYQSHNKYLLISAIVIFCLAQVFMYSNLDFRTNSLLIGNYGAYIISSIAGVIIIFNIGKRLEYINVFNYIGKNSIVYFVMHWPLIYLLRNIFMCNDWLSYSYVYSCLSGLIIALLMPLIVELINRRLSFLLGGKFSLYFLNKDIKLLVGILKK